ncbi:hypothetical protein [Streptomyces sp. NPDC048392]|uniref:hypothetical protein n=1 Tax=Streptomyces sp. NPDC048392 TaxID=3365543 RepID=UPI00371A5262
MERKGNIMGPINPKDAREAISRAEAAQADGAERAVRPTWYYPALGGGLLLAFASFSLDMATFGVPIGLVIVPVAVETLARQATGASPYRSYTGPATRGIAVAFVLLTAALFALGLALESAVGLTGAMAVAGLAAAAVTVVTGRRLDRARAAQLGTTGGEV